MSDSTLADNTAAGGGGLYGADASGSLTSDTLAGNDAGFGGGIALSGSDLGVGASIVAENGAGGDCHGTVADLGDNLDDDGTCQFVAAGDRSDVPADLDPAGLAANGGPTDTFALQSDSPAVALATGSFCNAPDQRGVARPSPCDAGAYDTVQSPFFDAQVSGTQTYGGAPALQASTDAPEGVTTSGAVTCATADGDAALASLGAGSHTLDGSSCSGLTSSDSRYEILYQGVPGGFVVSPDTTTTSLTADVASESYGTEGATTFTVTVRTGNGESVPSGETVGVAVGSASCAAPLAPDTGGGTGTCHLSGSAVPSGAYTASAAYPGDTDLAASDPATTPFDVVATVGAVSPSDGPYSGGTTVAIGGSGFAGATAVYFGSSAAASFSVNSESSITAVSPAGATGTVDVTVVGPGGPSATGTSDQFTYTNAVVTSYSCSVQDLAGTTSFPVVLSELPSPPPSIAAGGTFSTDLAAQVTIPASVISAESASSVTVDSTSVTLDGLDGSGDPSAAVSPDAESSSAVNLPLSQTTGAPVGPFTFSTTYNPLTWQTGPGSGTVAFTPGLLSASITFVDAGNPRTRDISCAPPSGVPALDSTSVTAPPPTPTLSVPPTVPPLQSQVSPGSDGGWSLTVTNTSTVTVGGVAASMEAADGGTALSWDLGGISAAGTKGCSSPTPGDLSCDLGTLPAGASATVNALVGTSNLAAGTTISASATVSSPVTSTVDVTLGPVAVESTQEGNQSVAVPGVSDQSDSNPVSGGVPATVDLTLPRGRITTSTGSTVKPPPVGVSLQVLDPSAEPALCPPDNGGCEGQIVDIEGDFSAYTNAAHPMRAIIDIYYGDSVPAGSLYMLEPSGAVVALGRCLLSGGVFNTPCERGSQKVMGPPGALYVQEKVLFTGNDPAYGRG